MDIAEIGWHPHYPALRVAGVVEDSIVDGPGLRLSVFVQGCLHHCAGCHNPSSHDLAGGSDYEFDQLLQRLQSNPLLDGLTLSGGDPFFQAGTCAQWLRALSRTSLHLMAYTGFRWEELMGPARTAQRMELLSQIHWLVDGRFVQSLRTVDAPWRGSSNQRLIDVQASLCSGEVVLVAQPQSLMAWREEHMQVPVYEMQGAWHRGAPV